ncbi:MAG: SDR family oxidoreductase [Leptospiraceae bacterium]|nr:SDR family oxidoreductase [Leptospiraceae bacterium]MDW8306933.1 SDR family oxidoreductase [Leptospiraceae bacterium]
MPHRFHGRYLITGASQGIGFEIARILGKRNCELLLLSRSETKLEKARKLLAKDNISCQTITCDLAKPESIQKAAKQIRRSCATLNGIINNAGYAYPGYFHELPIEEFSKTMAVDYLGAALISRELVELVAKGGLLSFTSSVVGFMGVFGYSAYAPAKFALMGLAETLRQELYFRDIQVSVLCPPDTDTPGYHEENKTKPPETMALSKTAKLMTAQEVAESFVRGVERGQFLITCNLESAFLYHFHRIFPSLSHRIILGLIKKARKKQS